ncbi:tRNA (cytidine(34)-2'-O)-methyltransferase [Halobacteriovorax sp. JY17]|uniref:tRNA (cytidine(34)-2'-O)-methyltransferase n=1 Tax=Halobacteriovorax sp. JY17 TaxID=2014617 RepID=UPI000C3911DF|nr:tRNA (cytidine(34)-2'-O)-methyltransferase [Halobacteriovorax sp. JY17]PIK13890.1 MAG: tRNA (uridine(34)/cytosine(34)/5-carboxymethylaminomethyluridine(34)-2'-O)-methyltransferase TrmL [Halobacteriovorax sp. JY17]
MKKPLFKIVLNAPEIPGNTGSIGRTCAALNLELILIHPLGFDISEKAVRRAGLDYWDSIKISEYQSFDEFLETEKPSLEKLFFFTKSAQKNIFETSIQEDSYLIFGSESTGLPKELLSKYPSNQISLPILNENIRSLNLASIATAASYEAIRQIQFS